MKIKTAKVHCDFFVIDAKKTVDTIGERLPFVAKFLKNHTKYGYLQHIEVKPEHRGKGAGTAMMARAIRMMQRKSCSAVLLVVDVEGDVPRLTRWYKRLGFRVLGYSNGNPNEMFSQLFRVLAGGPPSETFMGLSLAKKV